VPNRRRVIATAGNVPAHWVIHAVRPIWRGGGAHEQRLLATAYRESLARAKEVAARTITFPAISCGIYGNPVAEGAGVALETAHEELAAGTPIEPAAVVPRTTGWPGSRPRCVTCDSPADNCRQPAQSVAEDLSTPLT
jgi:O-acetyl-ADP-ribose deacetylase (regulator of RNase III)